MSGATTLFVDNKLSRYPICIFTKRGDADCLCAKRTLDILFSKFPGGIYELIEYIEIESRQDCTAIENYLMKLSLNDTRVVPQIYVNGKYSGSLFDLRNKSKDFEEKLKQVVEMRL